MEENGSITTDPGIAFYPMWIAAIGLWGVTIEEMGRAPPVHRKLDVSRLMSSRMKKRILPG